MADLAAIRETLADALNTLPDMNAYPRKPGTINPPCWIVEPALVSWETSMGRGVEQWSFDLWGLCGLASSEAAELQLEKWFGGIQDVKDAIQSAPLQVFARQAERFDGIQIGQVTYLAVKVQTEVLA